MTTPLLSTGMSAKRFLAVVYIAAACYFAVSYWILWERPIFSPLFAIWGKQFGDVRELPLGEDWTRRYTQGILPSKGAGFIERNALIFLPFSARDGKSKLEIEVKSLFVNPGYRTEIKILINDRPVKQAPLSHDWQTLEVNLPQPNRFMPWDLRLQFNVEKVSPVPRYAGAEVLRFNPDENGFWVWRSREWERGSGELLAGSVRVERDGNIIMVGEERLRLENWPIIVALAPWDTLRLRHPFLAVELPTAACRVIRIK